MRLVSHYDRQEARTVAFSVEKPWVAVPSTSQRPAKLMPNDERIFKMPAGYNGRPIGVSLETRRNVPRWVSMVFGEVNTGVSFLFCTRTREHYSLHQRYEKKLPLLISLP